MAYSKTNKAKIQYYLDNPEFVKHEYLELNKTTAQLSEEWGLPKSTVYNITKKLGLVGIKLAEKVTYCNEDKFNINDEIFCYLAGLTSADGYIDEKNHRVTLRMSIEAKEILERLHDYFEVSNLVAPYSGDGGYTQGYTMYDLTISSRKLLDELRKLNIYGRKKDLLVRFPDMSKFNDVQQEMYMRGLWDGDGTIRYHSYTSIFQESELFIQAIAEYLVDKHNAKLKVNPRIKDNIEIGYDLFTDTPSALRFYSWLYRHNLTFKIEKKYNRQF